VSVPALIAAQRERHAPSDARGTALAGRTFLAFDFGTRRVGVACGNGLLRRAQPLTTLVAQGDARFAAIASLIGQWQPDELVVGVPLHPDGAVHEHTLRARRFARRLRGRFRRPVHEVDERDTTADALASGASDPDAAAAALILEQFLRQQPQDDPRPGDGAA
jgi:putative pre-16S rRNA nuclease